MSDLENDLQALMPDMDVEIDGENVTVREYRFKEGLQIAAKAKDFLNDLEHLFLQDDGQAVDEVDLIDLQSLFGTHEDLITWLVSKSCDKSVEWVNGLSDSDGMALLNVWWTVNQPFFTRRLVQAALTRTVKKAAMLNYSKSLQH